MAVNIPEYQSTVVPTINDHPQVVKQPYNTVSELNVNPDGPENVENGYNGIKDPLVRLSKNMKLRMRHVGFKENAVAVDDEWKWNPETGMAEPPAGRTAGVKYAKADDKKYTNYGNVERTTVKPFGDNDPAGETNDSVTVTAGTSTANTDTDLVEAVPVLAVNNLQARRLKTEGRRGEVHDDPISEENYLTRPGMEVKTSETYLATVEAAAEADEEEVVEEETPTYTYTEVNQSEVTTPDPDTEYFTLIPDTDPAQYQKAEGLTAWAADTTYYTRTLVES